jgi:predicted N-acyltransferase
MSKATLKIRVVPAISDIAVLDWNSCASPEPPASGCSTTRAGAYNPFISHEFLTACELSQSATPRTGWHPQHLIAERDDGSIAGVVPCYLKSHSRGEYVFDRGWAEAYEHAGGSYYPKLQVSVPFTPATGPRLLVKPAPDADNVRAGLLQGLRELCGLRKASSVHITFMPKAEATLAEAQGFLLRTDQQFHWENSGHATFDDFLNSLSSRKRKLIKRERRDAVANGIEIVWLTGPDLTETVWDSFFRFYTDTGSRKWGQPYLTREFYSLIGQTMADKILLVMARRNGKYIAGAINFIGSDTLFGRHWGAIEHHPFLHFEVCYYQAIEYAIAHKLAHVEAGAQGEHKIARGYLPKTTYSAHYIAEPGFRRAVADYLKRERTYVAAAGEELGDLSPYRKGLIEQDA